MLFVYASTVHFSRTGWVGEKGFDVSLTSGTVFLAYMPEDPEGERAGH